MRWVFYRRRSRVHPADSHLREQTDQNAPICQQRCQHPLEAGPRSCRVTQSAISASVGVQPRPTPADPVKTAEAVHCQEDPFDRRGHTPAARKRGSKARAFPRSMAESSSRLRPARAKFSTLRLNGM